jgi:hypothetical protein
MTARLAVLEVRRWGDDDTTPIVLNDRRACGFYTNHLRRGCIGIHIEVGGHTRLVHLTTDEALRLSDLLRAMASADAEGAP